MEPDGPAHNSNLMPGDIIIKAGKTNIASIDDLHKYLDENTIGHQLELVVLRNNEIRKIAVIPGEI